MKDQELVFLLRSALDGCREQAERGLQAFAQHQENGKLCTLVQSARQRIIDVVNRLGPCSGSDTLLGAMAELDKVLQILGSAEVDGQ